MATVWISKKAENKVARPKPRSYNVYMIKKDGSTLLLDVFKSRAAAEKYAENMRFYKIDGKISVQDIY